MDMLELMLEKKSYKEIDLNTHISLKNNYVFFQVSKVASSTVKHMLQTIEVKGTSRKVIDVNDRYVSPHLWPSQMKKSAFLELLQNKQIKKVSFVRNPYSRVLSCYLHRIMKDINSPSNKSLSRYTGGLCGPEISFPDFVKVISEQRSIEQESHWRRQSDEILYDIVKDWSFIGRFENLQEDLQVLEEVLVNESSDCKYNDALNKSPMKTGAADKLKLYFDDKTQETLYDSFEDDFINFGYSRDI